MVLLSRWATGTIAEILPDSLGDVGQLTPMKWVWVIVLGLLCCDGRSRSLTPQFIVSVYHCCPFPFFRPSLNGLIRTTSLLLSGGGLGRPRCNILLSVPVSLDSSFELPPCAQTVFNSLVVGSCVLQRRPNSRWAGLVPIDSVGVFLNAKTAR